MLPTRHEGPTVRAMEKKGIKTEKGEFNRWIRRTNAFIRNLRKNLSVLLETIKEIKAELDKPQSDSVTVPLQRYFDMRNAKAYSQTARVNNLKELNTMANYLKAHEIYAIKDLESRVSDLKNTVDELKVTIDKEFAHMKEIRKVPEYLSILRELKPIVDGLQKIKFDKAKAKYKAEHEKELKQYYTVRRKLLEVCPDGKYDKSVWIKNTHNLNRLMQKPMPSSKPFVRNTSRFIIFSPAWKEDLATPSRPIRRKIIVNRRNADSFLSLRLHPKTRKDN